MEQLATTVAIKPVKSKSKAAWSSGLGRWIVDYYLIIVIISL